MVTFIAGRIIKARDISLAKGQAKYKDYFVNTTLYKKYQSDVNTVLRTTEREDGSGETYADCIVSE